MLNKIRFSFLLSFFGIYTIFANDFVFNSINSSHGLSDNQIRYILQLSDGRMVFTTSGNLNLYDGIHFKYIHRTSQHIYNLKNYSGAYRIYQEGDSLLWIKDQHKLMGVDLHLEKYIANLDSYFIRKGFHESVEDLFVDCNSGTWFLIGNNKLCRNSPSEIFDLSGTHGNLQDLATDNQHLYLFYNTGEVVCYNLKTKEILYRVSAYTKEEQNNFINTSLIVKRNKGIYQLRNGSKGGFFFFNTQNHSWKKILETDYSLYTLMITPNEMASISCPNGVWIINPENGHRHYMPVSRTIDGEIIDTEITTIFYDKQGGLWLGTIDRGLLYYHPTRYKFSYLGRSAFPDNITNTRDFTIRAFAEDSIGNIYLRSSIGVYQYHSTVGNNYRLTPVPMSSLPKDVQTGLNREFHPINPSNSYTSQCKDSRGWIWSGTEDGLMLYKSNSKEKRTFYTEDGLSNNFVHAILEDRERNIWVTTSCGISKIMIDSDSQVNFINFNSYDGTLNNEYTNNAIFEAKDGTLYFGGINGFNILKSNNIPVSHLPFKPIFINLFLRGEKIVPGLMYDDRMILSKVPSYTKGIELSYNQNFITLEYSALNFLNPSKVHYRYQLEGIDKDWNEVFAGTSDSAISKDGILRISYTNLPPGNYVLKVMTSTDNQTWEGDASVLNIKIHPPLWKTTTAYILYAIFLMTIFFIALYLYTHITRKKIEQQHKEEILLLRIRNLIGHCRQLEVEKSCYTSQIEVDEKTAEEEPPIDAADSVFLTHAIEMVEKNLHVAGYSVEQLSHDLCMDRTGLYRKLTTLLNQSPSLFIRSIRLQKAVQLILEKELSITEISERVGFSSVSYFGKCFKEIYNCRPMEYADKMKKST